MKIRPLRLALLMFATKRSGSVWLIASARRREKSLFCLIAHRYETAARLDNAAGLQVLHHPVDVDRGQPDHIADLGLGQRHGKAVTLGPARALHPLVARPQ